MTKTFARPIFVTRPMLPPLSEVIAGMERIYQSAIITNMGPFHQELESKLMAILGGQELVLFNNGTTALMAAIDALQLPAGSEVITTPFSFAASTHAITTQGLVPVFADLEPDHMTLDPNAVLAKITDKTSCILAVHVYGFPCDVDAFSKIQAQHNLKIIYDAAHAFGTELSGTRISAFGDASVFSFHATKLFNSIEGGCVAINTTGGGQRLRDFRNFGIRSEDHVSSVGINGKMSEIHALFGLLNLNQFRDEMAKRSIVRDIYLSELNGWNDIVVPRQKDGVKSSQQYFPIRLLRGRDYVYTTLKSYNVFTRRYFHPLISNFDCYSNLTTAGVLPVAERAGREVLCLPFYGDLADGTAQEIARLIKSIIAEAPQGAL
jgi:dTDP-4-amino-4,6-dideoxygalactose transaminase